MNNSSQNNFLSEATYENNNLNQSINKKKKLLNKLKKIARQSLI